MLSWWVGKPATNANRDEDEIDPPETPAPVFAARALKSAIFGTPKPIEETYIDEKDEELRQAEKDVNVEIRRPINMPKPSSKDIERAVASSPTKGILMTPGTANAKRKSVTFGAAVVDNEGKNRIGKSGLPNNCPGKFPSPWTPKDGAALPPAAKRTALTESLENSRELTNRKVRVAAPVPKQPLSADIKPTEKKTEAQTVVRGKKKVDVSVKHDYEDVTVDLDDPRSQSGRYWKSEFERYHEEAKIEMRALVKYKQLAKSYAMKKDGEALDLGAKLREEQRKVVAMEEKLGELASQIADRRMNGDGVDSPEMLKNLARQTALAVQYRDGVEQFKMALEERDAELHPGHDGRTFSPGTAKTLVEVSQELQKARYQVQEMNVLRSEMQSLRLSLTATERKVSKLNEENSKLSQDLNKAHEDLERSEKRRQSAEDHARHQEVLFQNLQKDYDGLKELAKLQRRDAEHLLHKRHDQVSDLKKELVSLKRRSAPVGHLDVAMQEARKEGAQPSKPMFDDLIAFNSPPAAKRALALEDMLGRGGGNKIFEDGDNAQHPPLRRIHKKKGGDTTSKENTRPQESKIPMWERSIKTLHQSDHEGPRSLLDETPKQGGKPQQLQPALSEISNNGQSSENNTPPVPVAALAGSLQKRFSALSLRARGSELPSIEPLLPGRAARAIHDKACGPPTSNTSAEPTRESLPRPRSSGRDGYGTMESPRLSSMASTGSRRTLPPERAAAAKARLDQRNAEKRRKLTSDLRGNSRN